MTGLVGVGLLLSFASLMTLHLSLAIALGQSSRWLGLLCALPPFAPLAIYWALKQRLYIRCGLWAASLLTYVSLLFAAYM